METLRPRYASVGHTEKPIVLDPTWSKIDVWDAVGGGGISEALEDRGGRNLPIGHALICLRSVEPIDFRWHVVAQVFYLSSQRDFMSA